MYYYVNFSWEICHTGNEYQRLGEQIHFILLTKCVSLEPPQEIKKSSYKNSPFFRLENFQEM